MSLLSEILTAEQIDELYKDGFRILPPAVDPFEIPAALIKPDWAYQWNKDASEGWYWVRHEDHPGWFAPPGTTGPVVMRGTGLGLFRKHKDKVDNTPEHSRKRSRAQLENWADKFGMFTGGATMLQTDGEEVIRTDIVAGKGVDTKVETFERPQTKTVELVSKLPKDMIQHIDVVFAVRDRIIGEITHEVDGRQYLRYPVENREIVDKFYAAIGDDKGAPWWPTLMAIVLPYAIAEVRKANFKPNQYEAESRS